MLTLEELELPYEQILAGREFGINHDTDFLAMNPNGLVPLLRDDESDLILWESNAIVRYLAAQYGQKRLWIDSPARRAEAENGWTGQTRRSVMLIADPDGISQNTTGRARSGRH